MLVREIPGARFFSSASRTRTTWVCAICCRRCGRRASPAASRAIARTPSRSSNWSQRLRPDVIGFSLIFQYMSPAFARVIETLRAAGCRSHIAIGGHYPSFDPAEVLQRIPGARFRRALRGRTDPGRIDGEAEPRRGLARHRRHRPPARRRGRRQSPPAGPGRSRSLAVPRPIGHRLSQPRLAYGFGARQPGLSLGLQLLQHPPVLRGPGRQAPAPAFARRGGGGDAPSSISSRARKCSCSRTTISWRPAGARARWAEQIASGVIEAGLKGQDRLQDQLPLGRGPITTRWPASPRPG